MLKEMPLFIYLFFFTKRTCLESKNKNKKGKKEYSEGDTT